MFRWLCYGNDPSSPSPQVDKGYILRREMSFTIANDIYIRYQSFRDKADMIAQIQKMQVCAPRAANSACVRALQLRHRLRPALVLCSLLASFRRWR
jgi:DNA primase catalytic subunit